MSTEKNNELVNTNKTNQRWFFLLNKLNMLYIEAFNDGKYMFPFIRSLKVLKKPDDKHDKRMYVFSP